MPYSNARNTGRKYLPPENNYITIPFPNEVEASAVQARKASHGIRGGMTKGLPFGIPNISSVVDFLRNRISIEEIILIGLIILLIGEEIKDEFLIIMLIYILLL